MFVPLPIIIACVLLIAFLSLRLLTRGDGRDDLMAAPTARPAAPRGTASKQSAPFVPESPVQPLSAELQEQVRDLLRRNRKIDAIKIIRDATKLSLKGAKDMAETIERQLH